MDDYFSGNKNEKDRSTGQHVDSPGSKDPRGFCEEMYPKTLIFGIICVLFGIISGAGEFFTKSNIVTSAALIVFIVAVLVYCNLMRKARYKYIK